MQFYEEAGRRTVGDPFILEQIQHHPHRACADGQGFRRGRVHPRDTLYYSEGPRARTGAHGASRTEPDSLRRHDPGIVAWEIRRNGT